MTNGATHMEIDSLSPGAKMRLRWLLQARPEQLTPEDMDWLIWLIKSGRGWGKTRTGAEDAAHYGRTHKRMREAIVAPTFGIGRDVCIEGESGLLSVLHEKEVASWNRSEGQLILRNGSKFKIFSAEQPERLRGPQHHRAWCEEMAAWRYLQETWDQLMFGLRLGVNPQVVITTTPKPHKLIKEIMQRATTRVTNGSTFENAANLSPAALAELRAKYAGTTLGLQELEGAIIEDVDGALWRRSDIDATRIDVGPNEWGEVVVAVDPSATATGDEAGIIVAASVNISGVPHAFILQDYSQQAPPDRWAMTAIHAFVEWEADRIIYERNQGGEMVASLLRTAARTYGLESYDVVLDSVHASDGKKARMMPVAQLYTELGGRRVHHLGHFAELEDEMTTWVEGDGHSPNRVDALVWAVHGLRGMVPSKRSRQLRYAS